MEGQLNTRSYTVAQSSYHRQTLGVLSTKKGLYEVVLTIQLIQAFK
jgi:hypothetical protein